MAKARIGIGLLAGCLLVGGAAGQALAAPTVSDMLSTNFRPHQEGVSITTPAAQEEAACKVEPVKRASKNVGWQLVDGQGRILRRFYAGNDDNRIDTYAFYKDGVEVYREIDANGNRKLDQFRWLNAGGSKWGLDDNEDGRIDAWKVISPEEASQEILHAVITRDFGRLQALMLTEAEAKALGLPAADGNRIRELQKGAAAKFQATVAKLNLNEKATWSHLMTGSPVCVPADQTGAKADLIKHAHGTILCEAAGKSEMLQTGEMIQVGAAWRIIDAPAAGLAAPDLPAGGSTVDDPELKKLLDDLNKIDAQAPKEGQGAEAVRFNLQRADLIERIVAKVKPEEREAWIRQVADCLSAAAEGSPANDTTAYKRLTSLEDQLVKAMPGSNLAAYVTYREMTADYHARLGASNGKEFEKIHDAWVERLAKFVQTYPKAEDTPDALLQLGMVNELLGKETPAKNWYRQLAANFAGNPMAVKAAGAVARLESEGKPFKLSGAQLGDPNKTFDVAELAGKVVVVYYWASTNEQCVGDFAKLKLLLEGHAAKGVVLVCVNLDATPDDALRFLRKAPAPGIHLAQPGGFDSPLATQYGVMLLPNLFVVGKDGKVVSRTVQIGGLEEEVKKLVK